LSDAWVPRGEASLDGAKEAGLLEVSKKWKAQLTDDEFDGVARVEPTRLTG
jgi:hypothetical protein